MKTKQTPQALILLSQSLMHTHTHIHYSMYTAVTSSYVYIMTAGKQECNKTVTDSLDTELHNRSILASISIYSHVLNQRQDEVQLSDSLRVKETFQNQLDEEVDGRRV